MEEKKYLDLLAKRDIQPTAIRILVLRTMMQAGRSVSLLDLETMLDTVDKSTIFRTLTLFLSHHLIHSIDDGTGSFKYAVCSDSCSCDVSDLHTHFHCEDGYADQRYLRCTILPGTTGSYGREVDTACRLGRAKQYAPHSQSHHKLCQTKRYRADCHNGRYGDCRPRTASHYGWNACPGGQHPPAD